MLCRHNGMSQPSLGEVVNSYSRTGRILHPVSKYLVRATWDEHLDETAKAELLAVLRKNLRRPQAARCSNQYS